jgi:hypothetical protein
VNDGFTTLENCIVENCIASFCFRGAMVNGPAGRLVATNCWFINNRTFGGQGEHRGPAATALLARTARADTNAPGIPTGLNLASRKPEGDTTNGVIAWREPFDDFGVGGYKDYRDGVEIADVPSPIYTATNTPLDGARFTIRAYDMAGNLSAPSASVGFADPHGRPTLRVARAANGVELSWNEWFTSFQLQATPALALSNWVNVGTVSNRVVVPSTQAQQYFWMRKP